MEERKRVIVAQANLLAQGLIEQTDTGIRLTNLGWNTAIAKWDTFADEDKLLLTAFLKKWGKI